MARPQYRPLLKIGQGTFSEVFLGVCDNVQPARHVALKRIHSLSLPSRMLNELSLLRRLGGRCNVAGVLDAYRAKNNVVLVLEFFDHDGFEYIVENATLADVRLYMVALFTALSHIHAHGVIHRDVKPANFLFSLADPRHGRLIDFGLAQTEADLRGRIPVMAPSSSAARRRPQALRTDDTLRRYGTGIASGRIGKPPTQDKRPMPKASRAGTRGYRAPEVLMRYVHQTTAIDVWSAGVIFMSLLTGRTPFFHSPDDLTSLMEIVTVFGTAPVQQAATALGKRVSFAAASQPINLRNLVRESLVDPRRPDQIDSALDLLGRVLTCNPQERITAADALAHPFLSEEPAKD